MKIRNHNSGRGFDKIAAGCLTAVTFLALPYANIIKTPAKPDLDLISIEQTAVPPPVTQPIPATPAPHKMTKPVPNLIQTPRPIVPLKAVLDFDVGKTDIHGDFNLNFAVGDNLDLTAENIFKINDVDRYPQPLVRLKPLYPTRARMRRIEGSVMVEFTITKNGKTRDINIISSSPPEIFDRAAVRAIERWHFKPAELNGKTVPVRILQNIKFELNK